MGGDWTPTLAMVVLQVGFAGLNVISKLALESGMSPYVMIAYRQIVATLALSPIAFFTEWKARMKITRGVIFLIFLCSLFGATANQLLYFIGLEYSTPTIACALSNTLPAITFIMAIPFRMETVEIKTAAGQAKILGTALCVGGSMLMTFYQGGLIKLWPSHIHWKYIEVMTASRGGDGEQQNMALGATLIIASSVAWAAWFIVHAKMSRTFSAPYTSSAIMCFMASIQCLLIGGAVERDASQWAVGFDIRLLASLYIGLVGSGFAVTLMSWCIEKRGPLFVSMFSPLLLVIVAVVGWAILDEQLHVGSVTGSILIVVGLYMVLWGKGREMTKVEVADEKASDEEQGITLGGGNVASLPIIQESMHCSNQERERGA